MCLLLELLQPDCLILRELLVLVLVDVLMELRGLSWERRLRGLMLLLMLQRLWLFCSFLLL